MILVFLLVLLLAYLGAFLGAEHRKDMRVRSAWWVASIALAAASAGVVLFVIWTATKATHATQIAWIGLETRRAEDSLEFGGSRQKATVSARMRYSIRSVVALWLTYSSG